MYLLGGWLHPSVTAAMHSTTALLIPWVGWKIYDLKSKSFQVIKNLTMIKQVIASRSFIMTRANFKTETNPFVLTVATQTSGNELVDMEFLDSLDKVENLVAYQRFERDGTYMIEAFGSRPLTMEQINILHKRAYSPHVCAKEYGKCRFVDFLVADDDLDDENHGIFGYSFDLNGHVVKASQVEGWWDATEPIGSNFFGERVSFPAKKMPLPGLGNLNCVWRALMWPPCLSTTTRVSIPGLSECHIPSVCDAANAEKQVRAGPGWKSISWVSKIKQSNFGIMWSSSLILQIHMSTLVFHIWGKDRPRKYPWFRVVLAA